MFLNFYELIFGYKLPTFYIFFYNKCLFYIFSAHHF
jgi:hypothetical protein